MAKNPKNILKSSTIVANSIKIKIVHIKKILKKEKKIIELYTSTYKFTLKSA